MPHISVSLGESDQLLSYDIAAELTIIDLKSFINAETGISVDLLVLFLNGQPLTDDAQTLQAAGITDHDMLAATVRSPQQQRQQQAGVRQQPPQSAHQPSQEEIHASIEQIRQHLATASREGHSRLMPELANAINDPARFRDAYLALDRGQREREAQRITRLTSDEFNAENQAEIEEAIRQEHIEREREAVMQEYPEFFAPVTMLYIDLEVNGHPVKAFVDSGAQATIMSPSCADACNVTRLIDKRFQGVAVGVGTSRILGRVHRAIVRIGDAELPCTFQVMEGKDIDMLLGLDMLKRYQASIDLHQNRLVLYGGVSVPFLPESEIPKKFLQATEDDPVVTGPGGTAIATKNETSNLAAGSSTAASGSPASSNFSSAGRTLGSAPTAPTSAPATTSAPTVESPIARPSAPTPAQAAPEFPQESIDTLQRLGATRAQAIEALRASGGNVDYAAGIIYDGF